MREKRKRIKTRFYDLTMMLLNIPLISSNNINMCILLSLLKILILISCLNIVKAIAPNSSIKIVGVTGGVTQFLPGSYVANFPRWNAELTNSETTISYKKLIGSGASSASTDDDHVTTSQQFINPTSLDELWWPQDIKTLQVRPSLDIFLRNGMPTYIMGGLQVRIPKGKDGNEWSNFGLCSQPLAKQWTTFSLSVENDFRVELFIGTSQIQTPDGDIMDWKPLLQSSAIHTSDTCDDEQSKEARKIGATERTMKALQVLGELLASLNENSAIADGLHILSIPVSSSWIDLPPLNGGSNKETYYKIVSVATSESDAKELLSLDEDLISLSAASILNVNVTSIAAGSESEFLPDVYRPLYLE